MSVAVPLVVAVRPVQSVLLCDYLIPFKKLHLSAGFLKSTLPPSNPAGSTVHGSGGFRFRRFGFPCGSAGSRVRGVPVQPSGSGGSCQKSATL